MAALVAGRALKWFGWILLVVVIAGVLFLVVFDWNALRGPISRAVAEKTGRELVIGGDLKPVWTWVHPRIRAERVSFSNPEWAKEEHLVRAEAAEISLSVLPLLRGRVVLPEVHLVRPEVALEIAPDGRKNWLLDETQSSERSRVEILRLTVDEGRLRFEDHARAISIDAQLATQGEAGGLVFSATGTYKEMPFATKGSGGAILSIRDTETPFPLKVEARIGNTSASAEGTVTGITTLSALDLNVTLRGETLERLYPILGIAFPDTSRYRTSGRLVRTDGAWRYENFTGRIGESDIAGTLQVEAGEKAGRKRPYMHGELRSKVLNFADLGPLVGTKQPRKDGVLPDGQFNAERWDSIDADVKIRAESIRRPEQLPIEHLATRIVMRDAVLNLDPLEFGVAGGRIAGTIKLDGREPPIRAATSLRLQKLQLAKLAPTDESKNTSIGDLSGVIELAGRGNSVGRMLATADGKIGVFVDGGEVSHFLMKLVALDLWGVAKLKLQGDEPVALRCWIADFGVKDGLMQANALVFDTEAVNIGGGGTINLKNEELNLKLTPQPKDSSLASLNSPLHVQGTFSDPKVRPDATAVAKGVGAIVMGIVNPVLSVIPLFQDAKGRDSNCRQLIADATGKKSASTGATTPKSAATPQDGEPRPARRTNREAAPARDSGR